MDDIDRKLRKIDKIVKKLGPPKAKEEPVYLASKPPPSGASGMSVSSGGFTIGAGQSNVVATSHTHTIAPSPVTGQVTYNTATSKLYFADANGAWVPLDGVTWNFNP